MRLKQVLKQVGVSLLIGLATNQIVTPIASTRNMVSALVLEKQDSPASEEVIQQNAALPKSASVVDYLNAASTLAYQEYDQDFCTEYSRATFEVYQKLVHYNTREDLSDKIRICADLKKKQGHVWIEYRDGDLIVPYQFDYDQTKVCVGARTMWGTKIPYPTWANASYRGGAIALLREE